MVQIFIGWLAEKAWSWRVVAGQNAAYDQFPCQYQIFYHARTKNTMWYDPVFKVCPHFNEVFTSQVIVLMSRQSSIHLCLLSPQLHVCSLLKKICMLRPAIGPLLQNSLAMGHLKRNVV